MMTPVTADTLAIGKKPTVLYFGAEWCKSCPAVKGYVNHNLDRFPNVTFHEVDVQASGEIALSMNVTALPTLIFFDGGKEVLRHSGSTSGTHMVKQLVNYAYV